MEDVNAPKIIAAKDIEGIEGKIDDTAFLVSGKISNDIKSYKDLKVINGVEAIEELVDFIEKNTFELLPDFDENCCRMCGFDCKTLCKKIIKGEKTRSDCILSSDRIQLFVDDSEIKIVSFVQKILKNAILGVVGELEGYKKDHNIRIEINGKE